MKTQSIALTPKLHIGIDIHKRSWKIHCSTDISSGKTFSMKPSSQKLKEYVSKYYPDYEVSVAYESGASGYRYHRDFVSFGWHSIVFNPADLFRTTKERSVKTDGIDAQSISRELKAGHLQSIEIPDEKREALRSLFRRRNDLVKEFRRIKSVIKMQLMYLGIDIPQEYDNDHWSHDFRNWIKDLEFDYETTGLSLQNRLDWFEFTDKNLRKVSNDLRSYCRKHYKKDYYLLRSIPGIGGIVACGILSELGDLRRFGSIKKLAGYVGISPGIYQSGDNYKTTGMTFRAHRLMRSYFIEAAWQSIRADPAMQAYYKKHYGKNTKKIIVKVARKLLSRTLAVIKTETPYEIGVVE